MREVLKLPNKTSPETPIGGEGQNKEIGLFGEKR